MFPEYISFDKMINYYMRGLKIETGIGKQRSKCTHKLFNLADAWFKNCI